MADTEDKRALEVIQGWQRDDADSSNTMNLYQQVADHFFQRENSIITKRPEGEDKSLPVIDPTGALDLQDMAAGMSAVVIPNGQFFFRLSARDNRLNNIERIRSYLNYCTQIMHEEMFRSNFLLEFNEYLNSLLGFGTACLFSGWDQATQSLFYKDWDVAFYRFRTDYMGNPDQCRIRWAYTAEQAYQLFGDMAGKKVIEAANNPKKQQEKTHFIFQVRRRRNRDATKSDNMNYPIEELVVNEAEKMIVREGGYLHFPYHITRWLVGSQEIWGRGQGTVALSADKELQRQKKSLLLCADLANNPPRQTLTGFEGTPKVYPGANNVVTEKDQITALDRNLQGNFPITKDTIQMQQDLIHRCFYVKVFAPLDNLPGDRRTTVEIIERVKAGYMRLILPSTRLYNEGLTPILVRTFHLLLRNHILPPPPPELRGLKIEYLGRLALALQEQQSDALQRYAQFSLLMEQIVPGFTEEVINVRRAGRRMATTFGLNEGDLNTEDEANAVRQKRDQMQQATMQMEAMQAAGKSFKDASSKPEAGSPAENMLAQIGG